MSLASEFQQMIHEQAPDWSDLHFHLELTDELRLDEARLLMAPTQLERIPGERTLFRFNVSRAYGYGCHMPLAAACLAKLDERMIAGRLTLVHTYHGVRSNYTHGPIFSS